MGQVSCVVGNDLIHSASSPRVNLALNTLVVFHCRLAYLHYFGAIWIGLLLGGRKALVEDVFRGHLVIGIEGELHQIVDGTARIGTCHRLFVPVHLLLALETLELKGGF